MRRILSGLVLCLAMQAAWALEADISLSMRAEKATTIVVDGQKLVQLKPVRRLAVGDILNITLNYHNNSPADAANIRIDNPIPAGTRFVLGSGYGQGAVFLVSYDNGATFEEDIHMRKEAVTHVRWEFNELAGNAVGEVGFQLRIEDINARLTH